jgi:hypothetical protein
VAIVREIQPANCKAKEREIHKDASAPEWFRKRKESPKRVGKGKGKYKGKPKGGDRTLQQRTVSPMIAPTGVKK